MKKIRVNLDKNSYDICIGPGLLSRTGELLRERGFAGRVMVITNPVVHEFIGDKLEQGLPPHFQADWLSVPDGEQFKSLDMAGKLYEQLTSFRAERGTPLLALGGGVIGDLAGFVAGTYQRGVPLVQIPTTLLAQVDSSIGGKTAVNHGLLKNQVGVFYQPRLVVSDISALDTLPPAEFKNGLAEVIKYGVIRDRRFFDYVKEHLPEIKAKDATALEHIVHESARIKAEVVVEDERDLGLRNILNFGHTIGHAVESVSNFGVSHGEAVAIGMCLAGRLSNRLGHFPNAELERLIALVAGAGLPTRLPELEPESIITAMGHDKKIADGKLRFVLPRTIGEVFVTDEGTGEALNEVLRR